MKDLELINRVKQLMERDADNPNSFARKVDIDPANLRRKLSGERSITRKGIFFMLGFYLIGMNLSDILDLTKEDYKDGRISFFRNKTNRLYDIRVEPEAKEIIDRYKDNSNSNELFSFMRITHSAGYAQFTTKCNHCLRSLGRKIYDGRRYDRTNDVQLSQT